jgi:hypothetical protein
MMTTSTRASCVTVLADRIWRHFKARDNKRGVIFIRKKVEEADFFRALKIFF